MIPSAHEKGPAKPGLSKYPQGGANTLQISGEISHSRPHPVQNPVQTLS
jgi:hypothetical protein